MAYTCGLGGIYHDSALCSQARVVQTLNSLEAENESLKRQVAALEKVAEAAREQNDELEFMYEEYGKADDHSLTRDAIDLKLAICRVMAELDLHCEARLAEALAEREKVRDE